MSGISPFFLNGGSARIRLNGVTLAWCTDVSYSIRVTHNAQHVLGLFEATSQDPQSYEVTGSFTIIRYAKGLKKFMEGTGPQTDLGAFLGTNSANPSVFNKLIGNKPGQPRGGVPDGISNDGNGVGSWGPSTGNKLASTLAGNSFGGKSRVDQSFDPSKLNVPSGFDMEIQQTSIGGETGVMARFRSCRLTGADFRLTKRGLAMQTFTFQANYVDEDTFNANSSGIDQNLI
jgi:hypothetical protein